MAKKYDPENCLFGTQTHVMTEELLNAMDSIVWSPDAPLWFQEFFDGVWDGDEFTVTAEQACWILETAEEAVRIDEEEEGGESGHREYFEIIFNVFDDFTNFQRMSAAENEE